MAAKPLKKCKTVSPSPSLSSLPDEILLDCLVRVPRRDYENLSSVSRRLRFLVRSPELYRLRSLLHKDSVYVCIRDGGRFSSGDFSSFLWFTLGRTRNTEYELVPISFPCRNLKMGCFSVGVDSEIYFIGGAPKPTELWILDTRSGKLRQGPMMRETRFTEKSAVGVADGKIYVTRELKNGSIQEEVFDLESQAWKDPAVPTNPDEKSGWKRMMDSSVTLEGKVYAIDKGSKSITVYDLRQGGRRMEKLEIPSDERVWRICVADNVLFAVFTKCGLAWLDDTNVWRVVSGDAQQLAPDLYRSEMVEYYGKLAVFWGAVTVTNKKEEKIWCALIGFRRVREEVCGTIVWSGAVATVPYNNFRFLHCLVASD